MPKTEDSNVVVIEAGYLVAFYGAQVSVGNLAYCFWLEAVLFARFIDDSLAFSCDLISARIYTKGLAL